ncbi:MAG: glycosyltransferase family 2 protein [Pseudomonadota bacterium]
MADSKNMQNSREASVMVVIPARDEAKALPELIPDIPPIVDRVIVVDNGSLDNTAQVARDLGADVLQVPEAGYGRACLVGSQHAIRLGADIIVYLDADRSDFPEQMNRLIEPIESGAADLVIGSRALGHCARGALTVQQRFGNRLACFLIRRIWNFQYTDLGPFRSVRSAVFGDLEMKEMTYGWTVEMQIKALQQGLRVREVATDYRRRIGKSKISGTVKGVILAGYCILRVIAVSGRRRDRTDYAASAKSA